MAPPMGEVHRRRRPAVCCLVLYVVVSVGAAAAETAEVSEQQGAYVLRGRKHLTVWDMGQMTKKGKTAIQEVKRDAPDEELRIPDFDRKGTRDIELLDAIHPGFDPKRDGLTEAEIQALSAYRHYKRHEAVSAGNAIGWGVADLAAFLTMGFSSPLPYLLGLAPVAASIALIVRNRQQKDAKAKFISIVRMRIKEALQRKRLGLETGNWSLREKLSPGVEKYYKADGGVIANAFA